jgi:hypothetical protein
MDKTLVELLRDSVAKASATSAGAYRSAGGGADDMDRFRRGAVPPAA